MYTDITANKSLKLRLWSVLWLYLLLFATFSCKTTNRIAYFQDLPDTLFSKAMIIPTATFQYPIIAPGDILEITILTSDTPLISNSNLPATPGLLLTVDANGNIQMPVLGSVHVNGYQISQIRDSLTILAGKFYKDPVVTLRLANFTITVLGEVPKPGIFVSDREKLSVLDALALAGDISIYGKKENVLVIRNRDSQREAIRLSLNSLAALQSSHFYLKQGDVVIVEPNKNKIAAARDAGKTRNYALIASGLSVLIIFISRLTF
ncbi:polysaccharide biosynthesis/export family protein [Dyadobacter sp. CY312]|uniref:polysaccharide biosynthesis/export family protein n=1 Tax=Dyadobacter sp. CY312 TaxID=2907303 RepID=UPI001F299EAB|nr:polysaccharide biosynthesis/export family protein [Dyadobacter sp. CY312]MCE7041959.1 polysaccharide biosynthesis/export family protein [Dyadobacter sp. CY312]